MQKTDWASLAQTDPTAYVQKRAAFEARLGEVQTLQAQQASIQQERAKAFIAEQSRALAERLPEWASDEGRAKVNQKATNYLKQAGFNETENKGVADHRLLLMILDAANYREMMAAQQSVSGKKSAPVAPRTQKPAASQDAKPKDARVVALKKQAMRTGRDDDIVAAALAALGNQ